MYSEDTPFIGYILYHVVEIHIMEMTLSFIYKKPFKYNLFLIFLLMNFFGKHTSHEYLSSFVTKCSIFMLAYQINFKICFKQVLLRII